MVRNDRSVRWNFPCKDQLPMLEELPDLFFGYDGTPVTTAGAWERQRVYLQAMLDHYMYGETPPWPDKVKGRLLHCEKRYDGAAVYEQARLVDEAGLEIEVEIIRPNREGRFHVIIWNQFDEVEICPEEQQVINRGYAILSFKRTQFAPDDEGCSEIAGGAFRHAYPDYQDARAVAIWAWGCSYCISYLMDCDWVGQLIVTGFSRGGKAALRAGAYDERIAVTAPVCSGTGGAGCFRHVAALRRSGSTIGESLGEMLCKSRFWYWFLDELAMFGDGEEMRLPFDLHTVRALIAPRALLCLEGLTDEWSDYQGGQLTWKASDRVYQLYGKKNLNAALYEASGHVFTAAMWVKLLDFCDKVIGDIENKA